jgi:hypothetical protein
MNEATLADPKVNERLLRDVPARRTGRLEEIGSLAVYPGAAVALLDSAFAHGFRAGAAGRDRRDQPDRWARAQDMGLAAWSSR